MSIEANLISIKKRMELSCARASRGVDDVELLAVSKKKSVEAIQEARDAGQKSFGENYVQEWRQKSEQITKSDIRWHIIGPLQKNKCKYVIGKVELIHTVDDLDLANELQRLCAQKNIKQNILLQINLGDESTKSGASLRDGAQLVREIQKLKNLNLQGLMALPPLFEEAEKSRPYFRRLRECANSWFETRGVLLSMGTSHDYEIAIEEGANIVRVGTAIFGERI